MLGLGLGLVLGLVNRQGWYFCWFFFGLRVRVRVIFLRLVFLVFFRVRVSVFYSVFKVFLFGD